MSKFLPFVCYILFFSLITHSGHSQTLRYHISMPYTSMSAYSNQQTDPFSFTQNQAALARVSYASAGVYGERRFMLNENSAYALAVALPTSLGNIGIQANYAGFADFNENKLALAYGRSLGKAVDIGIQFNYYSYRIPAYAGASSVNAELGAILHVTDKLNAGVQVSNPVPVKLGKQSDEQLASVYSFGLGYDASDHFYVSAEIVKEEDKAVSVNAGIQYQFAKQFFARAGMVSATGSGYAGAGVAWKNVRLDIATGYHPQLGFSPGLMLIYHFKQEKL